MFFIWIYQSTEWSPWRNLKPSAKDTDLYNPPNAEVKSPKKIIEVISQHKYIEGLCLSATTNFPNEEKKLFVAIKKYWKTQETSYQNVWNLHDFNR